jgi:hypothetical protein
MLVHIFLLLLLRPLLLLLTCCTACTSMNASTVAVGMHVCVDGIVPVGDRSVLRLILAALLFLATVLSLCDHSLFARKLSAIIHLSDAIPSV